MSVRAKVRNHRAPPLQAGCAPELSTLIVDDPYEHGAKLEAARNIRNDPLARLHSHHQIDDAQFYAGRAYQRDWEVAERGARAIDPTKEAVDGGRIPEPLTDEQIKARKRLVEIEVVLGRNTQIVIHAFLVERLSTERIAEAMFARSGARWANYYGKMIRDGLNTLAVEYRLATT